MLGVFPSGETVLGIKKIWLVSVMSMLSVLLLLSVVSVISVLSARATVLQIPPDRGLSENGTGNQTSRSVPKLLVPLCCQLQYRVTAQGCFETNGTVNRFPALYRSDGGMALLDEAPTVDSFRFVVRDPCNNGDRYRLDPDEYPDDRFMFLDNGTIYKPVENVVLEQNFCFARMNRDEYVVLVCFESEEEQESLLPIGLIISTPFFFATFLVYTVIPELRNMHGLTLRGYVGCLFLAYTMLAVVQVTPEELVTDPLCVAFGTSSRELTSGAKRRKDK